MSVARSHIASASGLPGVYLLQAHYLHQHFSRHSHDGYALGVIEEGVLRFSYMHRNLAAPAGTVNMVVPGECHDGYPGDDRGWAYRMLYLEPDVVEKTALDMTGKWGLPDFKDGVLEDVQLAGAVQRTHRRLMDADTSRLERDSLLIDLLGMWIGRHAEGVQLGRFRDCHRAVNRVRDYLADMPAHTPSLRELADVAHLSPYHLIRIYTRETGQSPHEYLTQLRVNKARDMLSAPASLAAIAADCGFADQSHMTRHFKRQYGVTPGSFRNIILNRHVQDM